MVGGEISEPEKLFPVLPWFFLTLSEAWRQFTQPLPVLVVIIHDFCGANLPTNLCPPLWKMQNWRGLWKPNTKSNFSICSLCWIPLTAEILSLFSRPVPKMICWVWEEQFQVFGFCCSVCVSAHGTSVSFCSLCSLLLPGGQTSPSQNCFIQFITNPVATSAL